MDGVETGGDSRRQAWSVHDGQFFAAHLKHGQPRAPAERRLAHSEQLNAWVEGCTDFVGVESTIDAPFPRTVSSSQMILPDDDDAFE